MIKDLILISFHSLKKTLNLMSAFRVDLLYLLLYSKDDGIPWSRRTHPFDGYQSIPLKFSGKSIS